MDNKAELEHFVTRYPHLVGKVVDINRQKDRLLRLDLTSANTEMTADDIADTTVFANWVSSKLKNTGCKYGVGGYFENRTIYARSQLFDSTGEPRRLHLGVDIWAEAGTPVFCPIAGRVHSFKDNDNFGDYGPTIIIEHSLNGLKLFSLYGHLNRLSLVGCHAGMPVKQNDQIAEFGNMAENGNWPPHLHFQLMFDMEGKTGDYPGVCSKRDKERYFKNIPDPEIILQFEALTINNVSG